MKRKDYWNLFWLSGLPEAWMMSRPDRDQFNAVDMTAQMLSRGGPDLPEEAEALERNLAEKETAEKNGPF